MNDSIAWEKDFPNGYGHTSIAFLKRCAGYETAKNGDIYAAEYVVSRCVKHDRLKKLREQYPNAVLLPVISKNKLPQAFADIIGLPVWRGVRLVNMAERKLLQAMERFLHKPLFEGHIDIGLSYIIVDDVVTQGGTISALRDFILMCGGKVVAVTALAFAIGSHAIVPSRKNMIRLKIKYGLLLNTVLQEFAVTNRIENLTNSQAKYLLMFSNINNIQNKIFSCFKMKTKL